MIDPFNYIRKLEAKQRKNSLNEWIAEARQSNDLSVRIIAYNILLDIKYGNISEKFREKVITNLIDYLHEMRTKYPRKELYDQIIGFVNREDEEKGEEIFCCGKDITIDHKLSLGRVMEWEIIDGLIHQGDRYPGERIPQKKEEIYNLLYELNKANKMPLLRGSAPIFWIFKRDEIKKCQNSGERCNLDVKCDKTLPCNLDLICKHLGITIGKGVCLFEINFSRKSVEGAFMSPTVFDSKFRLTFRSAPGKWGKTINIENARDGVDEAIHKEHPWPEDFEVTRTGVTSQDIDFDQNLKMSLLKKLEKEFNKG
jgi:hypothetical protein